MAFNPCSIESYLTLFRRIMSPSYAQPLEDEANGLGWDVVRGLAIMWERADAAFNVAQQAFFLKPHSIQTGPHASSARRAIGEILVTRLAPANWDLVVPVGQIVEAVITDSYGEDLLVQQYRVTTAGTLAIGTTGPLTLPVEALFEGYEGNVPAGYVVRILAQGRATMRAVIAAADRIEVVANPLLPSDRFQLGFTGRYGRAVQLAGLPTLVGPTVFSPRQILSTLGDSTATVSPAYDAADVGKEIQWELEELIDLGVSVKQPNPITGGVADGLAAIATDRGTARVQGETDEQMADRLQLLSDVVSPAAIDRTAKRVLAGSGIRYQILETRDTEGLMGFVLDLHPFDLPDTSLLTPKIAGSELPGQGIVYLSEAMAQRFFIVAVSGSNLGEFGLAYDADMVPPNAYDLTTAAGFYDGSPVGFTALISQLWEAINQTRAAGVGFAIVLDPNI